VAQHLVVRMDARAQVIERGIVGPVPMVTPDRCAEGRRTAECMRLRQQSIVVFVHGSRSRSVRVPRAAPAHSTSPCQATRCRQLAPGPATIVGSP
jgi:hypothetical protein